VKSRSGEHNGYFDLFRDRLMFIIQNNLGEVIGFGGRVLDNSVQPKYLNSPETLLFHKSKTLYGLNETSKFIRAQDQALIVEGYMDLITLYQSSIQNVAAPLGTAFTLDQAKILVRVTKNIVVLFDGDDAGQRAAERALPILFEAESYPKGLVLPDGLDPDDFIKKYGAEALIKKISGAEDLLSLILKKWMEGYRGEISDKMKMLELLKPVFSSIKNQAFRNLCLREVSLKMRVEPRWLMESLTSAAKVPPLSKNQSFSKEGSKAPANPVIQENIQNVGRLAESKALINLKGAPKVELFLLAFALRDFNSKNWEQILHTDIRSHITHHGVSQVLDKAEELSGQRGLQSATLLSLVLNFIENPDAFTAIFSEIPEHEKERDEKMFSDCVRKVRMNYFDLSIKKIIRDINLQPTDDKLKQLEKLKKDRLQ
jgi:DNA primase